MTEVHPGGPMRRVDGNAIAGMLAEVLGSDVTMLVGLCGLCGSSAALAEAIVELDDDCAIVLCRACTHTLFTLIRDRGSLRLTIGALAALEG